MSALRPTPSRKANLHRLRAMKESGERITVLTCYDVLFARMLEAEGVDLILVGDSLGQVVLGYDSTLPVTMDEMIHHGKAVRRGAPNTFLVVDMPFLSYQVSPEEAVRNAGRVMKETGAEAVKVEGGEPRVCEAVQRMVSAGIPVMGHVGLTPQSVHALGGYRVQGRDEEVATRIRNEAEALAEAGCFSLVLELVPGELAAEISASLPIPTIGIGAGVGCDGQVLVLPDMLGLNPGFTPRFLKHYAELEGAARKGIRAYLKEVRKGSFPGPDQTFGDEA